MGDVSKICKLLVLLSLGSGFTSCAFWNPDPAEKLVDKLEDHTDQLKNSSLSRISFSFVPDVQRVKMSPRQTDDVTIKVVPRTRSTTDKASSIIIISDWFWTTYHNRFLTVSKGFKGFKQTKELGEPFQVILEKSEGRVYWTELR